MASPNESSRPQQPDPQWLERMYLNTLRVPSHGDFLARWQAVSALARKRLPGQIDVAYGPGPRQRLDAFAAPAPGRAAPLLIFVPGGAGRGPGKAHYSFVAEAACALGAAVLVLDTDACPAVSLPHITLQVAQAVAWGWQHARDLRASPRRLAVLGHGLGAQAAAMMLLCAWPLVQPGMPAQAVQRGMGLSGLYDLQPLMHTPSLQEALRLTPPQVAQASPARALAPARGMFWCLAGADESGEHLRQNRLLRQHWGRPRVPLVQTLAGLHHYSLLQAAATPGTRAHAALRRLLAA